MKRTITANARYWLAYLDARAEDVPLAEFDIRGAARALDALMTVPEAWSLTLALALALHPHLERRGYWSNWDDFLHVLAERARQRADRAAEVELLVRRGAVQRQRNDYPAAIVSQRRAWWLCRSPLVWEQGNDQAGRARALSNLGDLYRLQGRFGRAEVLCQGALALLEALEHTARLAYTENHLGLVYLDQGRWSEALPHLERSKTLWQRIDERHGLAKTLQNLGVLHHVCGNAETALDCFEQAIHHYQAVGDEVHAAHAQLNVGNVYLKQPDLLRAEMAYSQAESVLKRVGDSLNLAYARHNLGIVYTRLGNWAEAQACFQRALEQWRNIEHVWNLANTLSELAGLHLARGCWPQAQACLDEAQQLVGERPEAHYGSLQRELVERQQELRRLAGSKERQGEVGPDKELEPTSAD